MSLYHFAYRNLKVIVEQYHTTNKKRKEKQKRTKKDVIHWIQDPRKVLPREGSDGGSQGMHPLGDAHHGTSD
jgi:hypothetical protein